MLGVDLITEEIKESKNFQILSKIFSYHYVNKDNLKPIISYDEFKQVLINFIEEIMNDYLIKSGNTREKGSCEIVKFNKGKAGDCIDTKIRLDEDDEVIGMESIISGGKATLLAGHPDVKGR